MQLAQVTASIQVSSLHSCRDLEYCQYLGNLTGAINTTAAGGTGAFTSKEAVEDTALRYFNQAIIL